MNCELGGGIGAELRMATATQPGGEVDHGPAPAFDHAGHHGARGVENAVDIDGKGVAPVLCADAEHGAEAGDASIVDKNVGAPER